MLKQLEAIAAGKATKKTFEELRQNFEETQERVNATMIKLNEVRGKLAGSKVANQVDLILHDFNYGKSMIRSEIQVIVEFGIRGERDRARRVCNKDAQQRIGAATSNGVRGVGEQLKNETYRRNNPDGVRRKNADC